MRTKHIVTLLLVASLGAVAHARIGETPKQIEARYGKPVLDLFSTRDDLSGDAFYEANGFTIAVTFKNGISVEEEFTKKALSDEAIKGLMGLYEDFSKWKEVDKKVYWLESVNQNKTHYICYKSADGKLYANLFRPYVSKIPSSSDEPKDELIIQSAQYADTKDIELKRLMEKARERRQKEQSEKEERQKNPLKGF